MVHCRDVCTSRFKNLKLGMASSHGILTPQPLHRWLVAAGSGDCAATADQQSAGGWVKLYAHTIYLLSAACLSQPGCDDLGPGALLLSGGSWGPKVLAWLLSLFANFMCIHVKRDFPRQILCHSHISLCQFFLRLNAFIQTVRLTPA